MGEDHASVALHARSKETFLGSRRYLVFCRSFAHLSPRVLGSEELSLPPLVGVQRRSGAQMPLPAVASTLVGRHLVRVPDSCH